MSQNREESHDNIFMAYSIHLSGDGLFAFKCDGCVKAFWGRSWGELLAQCVINNITLHESIRPLQAHRHTCST